MEFKRSYLESELVFCKDLSILLSGPSGTCADPATLSLHRSKNNPDTGLYVARCRGEILIIKYYV